jgi:hypothetical protein
MALEGNFDYAMLDFQGPSSAVIKCLRKPTGGLPDTRRRMDKYPEFDKRERLGSSATGAVPASGRVARTPEDPIGEGDEVRLQYKGRQLFVIVTRVVAPHESYEGRVHRFVDPQLVEGLKVNWIVGFRHEDIWSVE